jgi:DNA polymerase I-like protein with 3'-5' exonuclease and polymerase domains
VSAFVVVDIETTGKNAHRDELLCVGIGRRVHPPEAGLLHAAEVMHRPGVVLVAHTNFDLRWLMLQGLALGQAHYHDTKVMAWMLDATQELGLDALCERYCGYRPRKVIRQRGGRPWFESDTVGLVPMEDAPWDELAAYNRSDLDAEADLYEELRRQLRQRGLWHQFLVEEAPFSKLLLEMECAGMPFDAQAAREQLATIEERMRAAEAWLVEVSGAPNFNLRSGEQVARLLYTDVWTQELRFPIPRLNGKSAMEKAHTVERIKPAGVRVTKIGRDYAYGELLLDGMGLAPPKRSKKQKTPRPSVSGKTLAVLYGSNPWIAAYVDWKKDDKIVGYLRDWIEREHEGALFGRFDQSGTVTGRLAGREPNLQQVATEGEIRGLFRGDLVVGDYSGLEVRISAHFSLDPVMLDIFESGGDLYGTLAAEAWGGPASKENEGRGLMKVVMLSSQYGTGPETLSELLALAGLKGYTVQKARQFLLDLARTLPRLFEWRQEVIAQAERDGYITTIGGRQRQLAGINSAAWELKGKAERQAVNSLVQGSAADIVRRAMLAARDAIDPDVARICLQVHDEIIWQRGPAWEDSVFPSLVEVCQHGHGFTLNVPLIFEAKIAQSWGDKDGSSGQVHAGTYEHLADVNSGGTP